MVLSDTRTVVTILPIKFEPRDQIFLSLNTHLNVIETPIDYRRKLIVVSKVV
jgi:hypothetical protein